MSKNGKVKKAMNVEKRRLQMEEALECLPLKQAAASHTMTVANDEPTIRVAKKQPKLCTFQHCQRYVDPSCTVCPYCGSALPD